MQRTIRQGGHDYINPACFVFSDAARRKIAQLRTAFPGKTIAFDWARSVKQTAADGKTRSLGDMLIVGLGTPEESEPDFAIELDGATVELAIPADVTTAKAPTIDTDARGKLLLR